MTLWNHYHTPETVEAAVADLARYDGHAHIVAGGTDLLLELQQGRRPPVAALVDVTRIPEMRAIALEGGAITLGAAVTHTEIVASEILAQRATCLVESCGVIGGPQVRNVATLGGNVAHAMPAADGTVSLVALDAEAEVAGPEGRRWLPILDLFAGPGKSNVDHTRALISRFRIPATGARARTSFKRIMRPQGVALPILGMGVWAEFEADGRTLAGARISLGPAGPTPMRARAAEAYLAGRDISPEAVRAAAQLVLKEARLRTSPHRATREYRIELIDVLMRRNFDSVRNRIGQTVVEPEGVGEV